MSLKFPVLELERTANGAITDGKIVKTGATEGSVAHATAATDAITGVASHDAADLKTIRIMTMGVAKVKLGGTVTEGAAITAGAAGVGVAAAPGAGINNRIVGFALQPGVSGDLISVQLALGQIQG